MVLRRHQNQPWTRFRGTRLGGAAAQMNDANHRGIRCENTSPHGNRDGEAKNQRHEQRDHESHLIKLQLSDAATHTYVVGNSQRLLYNLPALTPAASDDPDAP
jgi:hypothetical protein